MSVREACHVGRMVGCSSHDVDIELEHGVGVVEADGLPQHVPARHPELPRAADHRQLPDRRADVVAAHHGDGAAGVRAGGEHHVHGHQQLRVPRGRPDVVALRAPHHRRRPRRARRQHVVDHDRVAHVALGPVHHLHRRRRRAGEHVVHEEVQVRRRRDGPRGRADGEHDGHGEQRRVELAGSHGGARRRVCLCLYSVDALACELANAYIDSSSRSRCQVE